MTAPSYVNDSHYTNFNRACYVVGFILFVLTILAGRDGQWPIVVLLAWVNSPGILTFIGYIFEEDDVATILNPARQSWAFIFGDIIFLPLCLAGAAVVWDQSSNLHFSHTWWWVLASFAFGVFFAFLFHTVLDGPNYQKAGEGMRLISPSKLWHDHGTYFSLGASLAYLAVPALITKSSWTDHLGDTVIVAVGIGGWAVMGILDLFRGLEISDLHPRMDNN